MASPIDRIISAESGGDPQASNPNSSAVGAGQFLAATWLDTLAKHRPDITGSSDELLALRKDPVLSREMTAAYAADNSSILSKAGLPSTDGNVYLSHFAGPQGAVSVLQAHPDAPVADILGPGVVRANPFLAKMTAADLQAWAARKVGGQQPPAAPAPQQAALFAPPAPTAPIFAQAPPAPQQAPQQQAAPDAAPYQPPAMAQMPPIFASPRPRVDLTKLRAAFQPPQFYRG